MDPIRLHGARAHNLTGFDLDLPRDRLVVVCGVSGSGKSSLVFHTLHAEGRRRYLEALAGSLRGRSLPAPEIDDLTGLPPTIALDQRWATPTDRSTVASQAELMDGLRVLWARAGTAHCPRCDAPVVPTPLDAAVGRLLALPAGTALTLEAPVAVRGPGALDEVARAGFSRVRLDGEVMRVEEIPAHRIGPDAAIAVVVDRIRLADDRRDRLQDGARLAARVGGGIWTARWADGALAFVDRPLCAACRVELPPLTPRSLSWGHPDGACPRCEGAGTDGDAPCAACGGTRLRPEARAVRWRGSTLPDLTRRTVADARQWLADTPSDPVATPLATELVRRLDLLARLGLQELPLDHRAARLSTGEQQRLRLVRAASARLTGVCYLLDEPVAGLGSSEIAAVLDHLRALIAQGNSVIAVEHHPAVIAAADWIIELGPGAGTQGGQIVFQGSPAAFAAADTLTAGWCAGRAQLTRPRRSPGPPVTLADRALPTRALVAITGPSGSGKSTLLRAMHSRFDDDPSARPPTADALPFARCVRVDRLGVRAARSMPATYVGLWEPLRELLASTREAQVRGFGPSFFSLATKGGRCEACQGTGERRVDLALLPEVVLPCDVCEGRRFAADVRTIRWKGRSPDEILASRIDEAATFLAGHPKLDAILRVLRACGLGDVPLGQPTSALSGGEAQRLALARELLRAGSPQDTLYLLDAPTVGLHPADVQQLLGVLSQLVDQGGTVWAATHDPAFAAIADVTVAL